MRWQVGPVMAVPVWAMPVLAMLVWAALPVRAAGWPEGISGADAGRMVRAAMAAAGQEAGAFSDPVRRFPPCGGDVTVGPRRGSWATAELRCSAPAWVRAVRTGAAVQPVERGQDAPGAVEGPLVQGPLVVTLLRSVARGALVGAGDVALRPLPARSGDGIFTEAAAVIGRRARVALGAGQPLLLRQLEPDWAVRAGNPLSLAAMAGGLTVSVPAEALEDGQLGDVIRVVNLSSRREVKALVTGDNRVTAQTNLR